MATKNEREAAKAAKAEAERVQRIRLGDARFDAMTAKQRIAERDAHEAVRLKRPFLIDEQGRSPDGLPPNARRRYVPEPYNPPTRVNPWDKWQK